MQVWCWATFGVGVMFALGAAPATDMGVRLFYDFVYWPIDGASPYGDSVRFTAALLGAVMIGWAMTIFTLVAAADQVGATAWRGLTAAVVAWYVIDSAISVASGVAVNALSNTGFAVTYLIPVLASGVLGLSSGAAIARRS
jgi:hypothetical protein